MGIYSQYKFGDTVRLLDCQLASLVSNVGKVLEIDQRQQQAKVSIEILGRETILEIAFEFLEPCDSATYHARVQQEAVKNRLRWVQEICRELGIPESTSQPQSLAEFTGNYEGDHYSPWGGAVRLTLTPDGFFQRETHLDLGNTWFQHSSGYYLVHQSVAYINSLNSPHPDSGDDYRLPQRLHKMLEEGKRVLGSRKGIDRYMELLGKPVEERVYWPHPSPEFYLYEEY